MTNAEFARAIGCHVTTASRYRNGHRLPGVEKLEAIRSAFGLSHDEIHRLWQAGPQVFSAYLREKVFEDAA